MSLNLGLFQKKHKTNGDQWQDHYPVTRLMSLTGSIFFPWQLSRVLKEYIHALQINCIFLVKDLR